MDKYLQLDGRALRVLAHPLRARLLTLLRLHGAATATGLAGRLDTNTGATSYHLRKLAEVGLVEETGEGTGKQRFWAAAQESHGWSEGEVRDDPDALAAASWLRQHYWRQHAERVVAWEEASAAWPVEWQEAASMTDGVIEVTAAELRELMHELTSLFLKYRENSAGSQVHGRRQVMVHVQATPTDITDRPQS